MSSDHEDLDVEAPTHLDGSPVDKEEAARVHQKLVSGEMTVQAAPEVLAQLEEIGMNLETFKAALIKATRKTMS